MLRTCLLACGLILAAPTIAKTTSIVTDLHGKACKLIESGQRGASTRRCPGAGGFALLVHENEGRSSVDVVAPGKEAYQLDFWNVVAPGLSQVGRKAEWFIGARGVPSALLMRLDMVDQSNLYYPKVNTTIAVVRIDADGACVVLTLNASGARAQGDAVAAAHDRSLKCLGSFNIAREAEKEMDRP